MAYYKLIFFKKNNNNPTSLSFKERQNAKQQKQTKIKKGAEEIKRGKLLKSDSKIILIFISHNCDLPATLFSLSFQFFSCGRQSCGTLVFFIPLLCLTLVMMSVTFTHYTSSGSYIHIYKHKVLEVLIKHPLSNQSILLPFLLLLFKMYTRK